MGDQHQWWHGHGSVVVVGCLSLPRWRSAGSPPVSNGGSGGPRVLRDTGLRPVVDGYWWKDEPTTTWRSTMALIVLHAPLDPSIRDDARPACGACSRPGEAVTRNFRVISCDDCHDIVWGE